MDRTKIKDQFGQFKADVRRSCGTICIRCGVCSDNGGLQDGCESAE